MTFYTLTSFSGNGDTSNTDFNSYNTTTNFYTDFRHPIKIKPNSVIKLNFVKLYLINDLNKRPIYITSPSLSSNIDSQMGQLGKNGVLGIVNLADAEGQLETGNQNNFVVNDNFSYIQLNNAEELNISRIQIKVIWENGNECDNVKGYTNSGTSQDAEIPTTIGLQIVPPDFRYIN